MIEATQTRTETSSSATAHLLARMETLAQRMDEQAAEIVGLKAENARQSATISQLEATPAASPPAAAGMTRQMGRRGLITGVAALAALGVSQAFGARPAHAADGQALIMGQTSTSSSSTWVSRDVGGDGTGTNCLIAYPGNINGNGFLGYATGTGTGVAGFGQGTGLGVQAGSISGTALYAESTGNTYSYGVHARSKGLFAILGETTGATSAAGIRGQSTAGDGVQGTTGSGNGVAGFSNTGAGVHGASATSGYGVYGISSSNAGVYGKSTTNAGVFGDSPMVAVAGVSNPGIGVQGTSNTNAGVYGKSTSNAAVYGTSPYAGVYGTSTGIGVWGVSNGGTAVFGQSMGPGGFAGQFSGNVFINGSFTVVGGAKSAAVKKKDGSLARVYCQESPEPWFEDFGSAEIKGGQASIALDPGFDEVVDGNDYRVFLTEIGDCGGLFVSRKGPHRFEVKSRAGASANGSFDFRVVAKRADKVGGRLEKVEAPKHAANIASPAEPKVAERKEPPQMKEIKIVEGGERPQPSEKDGRGRPAAR